VEVGIFFDGTNNNEQRDRYGKRIGLIPPSQKEPIQIADRPLAVEEGNHSNIARLLAAFPRDKSAAGYFRFYVPGVGTPFEEIGELTESGAGKAFSKGGQPRIIWGLVQVLNAIHIALTGHQPLFDDLQGGSLAQAYGQEIGRTRYGTDGEDRSNRLTHEDWFKPHIDKLKAALAARPKPVIPSLTISVFGFSRGSAQAAAFCHLFSDLLENGMLAGIPARIRFLGLFDTVAAVGGSPSMSQTLPVPAAMFDGHWAWAGRILQPLPACVEGGLHCISAHEVRMNFPLTRVLGNLQEVYFPGVHSDVGGGYAPGEQGKGRGRQGALLSQIPLLHMYKAARLAGVPLLPYSELEARDKIDFEVDEGLASAWNAYTAELKNEGALLKKHMELFYRWRALRLGSLETSASFQSAGAQDQQDMRDANRMLAGDLDALRLRRERPNEVANAPENQPGPLSAEDIAQRNHRQQFRLRGGVPLDDWEDWALTIFDDPQPLPVEVIRFFDDHVHDSFAGFYLAGALTEYDRRKNVAEVMARYDDGQQPFGRDGQPKPAPRFNRFDTKIVETTLKVREAQAKQQAGETLTDEEAALVKQATFDTPYPVMTDEDSASLRNPLITTQTSTRREGGGYIVQRDCYPQTGFLLRRSVYQDELDRRPTTSSARPVGNARTNTLNHSKDVSVAPDIALSRDSRAEWA
jgi:hypothetical protein